MACPDYEARVKELAKAYPDAVKHCHTGDAHTEDFVRIVAADLHAIDPNVGLNGKRGNPHDISDDCINILDPVDGPGHTPSGQKCWVVDFMRNAGASNAEVVWNPLDDPVASTGANVPPNEVPEPIPVPPQPAPALKSRDQFYTEFQQVDDFYAAQDGLQRTNPRGMALVDAAGIPYADREAMGKWGYDLMAGSTVDECKAEIRTSDEWKQKHPAGA